MPRPMLIFVILPASYPIANIVHHAPGHSPIYTPGIQNIAFTTETLILQQGVVTHIHAIVIAATGVTISKSTVTP